MVGCESGLIGWFRKPCGTKVSRGFESLSHRLSPCSSADRASVSGTGGRRFKSSQGRLMEEKKKPVKREFSAGGVVYRKRKNGEIEWLICRASSHHKWVFPKGIIEKGEEAEETALREVEEETGIKAKIVARIKLLEKYVYQLKGTLILKNVVYFLMEFLPGEVKNPDFEVEEIAWLPYEQALKKLEFEGTKKVLGVAQKLLEEKEKQPQLL
jgi:bis(5'-nucleosidyl)-tetraphosphatase